jgi:hypothetical protein
MKNYVIGTNLIALTTDGEIERGRNETLEALRDILHKNGITPIEVVGRWEPSSTRSRSSNSERGSHASRATTTRSLVHEDLHNAATQGRTAEPLRHNGGRYT